MAVQLPPNGTGQVVDTFATVGAKERQVVIPCAPPASQFAVTHTPVAATQATITQAAGAAGVRNVCTGISASLGTVGAAQTIIQLNLRDGASGAGTILWSKSFILATNSFVSIDLADLYIPGTAATAMTLEFSAAGVAASVESVSLTGHTTA